ncbi:unnamed protein product, partial [Amoebophrya sp. A25]|eukprot:GSA25T00010490001.1
MDRERERARRRTDLATTLPDGRKVYRTQQLANRKRRTTASSSATSAPSGGRAARGKDKDTAFIKEDDR